MLHVCALFRVDPVRVFTPSNVSVSLAAKDRITARQLQRRRPDDHAGHARVLACQLPKGCVRRLLAGNVLLFGSHIRRFCQHLDRVPERRRCVYALLCCEEASVQLNPNCRVFGRHVLR